MPKQILQDVVPKKSIRDIPVPDRNPSSSKVKMRVEEKKMDEMDAGMDRSFKPLAPQEPEEPVAPVVPPYVPPRVRHERPQSSFDDGHFSKVGRRSSIWFWVGGIFLVVVIGFVIATLLSSADIVISLKAVDFPLADASFTASPSGTTAGGLSYQVINEQLDSAPTLVNGTTEQSVSTKSTGTIVIYNNYSSASQKLIATTRFETAGGNIYRIATGVTVPGKTAAGPGSVQATVTADQPGAQYNTDTSNSTGGLVDLTIPGFQGDPRYCATPNSTCAGFYARSITPFTGGFVGTTKVVSQADLQTAQITLDSALKDTLVKQALAQTPSGFVLYPGAYNIAFTSASTTLGAQGTTIVERGTLTGALLNRGELSDAIAVMAGVGGDSTSTEYLASNLDTLTFSLASGTPSLASTLAAPATAANTLSFSLDGNVHLVANVDTASVLNDSLGLPKSSISNLLVKYPGIDAVNLIVRPFWKTSIPTSPSKVTVTTKEDEVASSSTAQ